MTKITSGILIAGFTLSVIANEDITLKDCSKHESSHPEKAKKFLMCLDSNINLLERHRQTWITKLLLDTKKYQADTGNTQILPIMERALRNHEEYMEDSCRWRYLLDMPNATRSATAYKQCKITLLKAHISELQSSKILKDNVNAN
ncbi:hypothetical protein HUZ36_01565 [Pseudoalteromonas sp. McH1-7]|uniref:hypothetical protein n=1 Tax=Pseudoalteromonas TaxID=53246 RepID=UPI000FFEF4B5|nr:MULTISPECIES: hypothetical protein [Pseudoalteromonas]MDW7549918.1 hypothetical protein [Pseudoalteromonas peptidolytica]NUZ09458.1 hypothetical protein [Pseudoalteromonas sp. McH1-7]RXF06762.1 hypothetical protein D9603_01280 [Pseudoalteromonas sp. PS5]USD29747.1 hypothetical protein J8Z24_06570 [Pseudoalteromonas sp. SCSIO 43201]